MKNRFAVMIVAMTLFLVPAGAQAIDLYVDAAPNVYGSPAYAAWQAAAFADAANGTFINMASSINTCNVGTTNFEIEDEVVYSFGDLGKRLTWIYWIPGETVANLGNNDLFKISLLNTWDGELLDFYVVYYGSTWLEPTKWIDYDADGDGTTDGVIGTAGMAWWGAYGVNTPEALEADLQAWGTSSESWEFKADLNGEISSIVMNRRPVRVTKLFADCAAGAKNHGQFVKCVAKKTNALKNSGVLSGQDKGEIQSCAAQTDLP